MKFIQILLSTALLAISSNGTRLTSDMDLGSLAEIEPMDIILSETERDRALAERDRALAARDRALVERDRALAESERELSERDRVLAWAEAET